MRLFRADALLRGGRLKVESRVTKEKRQMRQAGGFPPV